MRAATAATVQQRGVRVGHLYIYPLRRPLTVVGRNEVCVPRPRHGASFVGALRRPINPVACLTVPGATGGTRSLTKRRASSFGSSTPPTPSPASGFQPPALLRNASISLFQSSRNRAYLEEVIVLVPKSWGPKETWARAPTPSVSRTGWQLHRDADVRLEPQGSPFGDNPFTVQHAGCGLQAKRLVLSAGFLRLVDEGGPKAAMYGPPERVFVREWAHLRYGVFNEAGYPGDPLYPAYTARTGSSDPTDVVLTTCTDTPLDLDWK
ncbi:unnamed protein product [Ixodes pacificus]